MSNAPNDLLFDTPVDAPAHSPQPAAKKRRNGKVKNIILDRQQLCWAPIDLEHLIDADHPARAIADMLQRIDMTPFEEDIQTREQQVGRPCWPVRELIAVWSYAYSMGVSSAREIERRMVYEPGLRWLVADRQINHHTLADFRVQQEQALEGLFVQILAVLEQEGMVDLQTVMHDGTKIEAVASTQSYHRRGTLEKHLERAQEAVRQLQSESQANDEVGDKRRASARQRAAREKLERMEAALEKMKELEEESAESRKAGLRVSESEAEARKMKGNDGGWGLNYNAQLSTEASHKVIVGVGLSTESNDLHQLEAAVEQVEDNCGKAPQQMVVDNGYATRENVEMMSEKQVELIAPWKEDSSREAGACAVNGIAKELASSQFRENGEGEGLSCKAGKELEKTGERKHHGVLRVIYQAKAEDCAECEWKVDCCGKKEGPRQVERVQESEAMKQYLERMKQPEAREVYKRRAEVAEFPNLWIKSVLGIRRFRVRGPTKAGMELTWAAIAYNIAQWRRVRWEVKDAGKKAA